MSRDGEVVSRHGVLTDAFRSSLDIFGGVFAVYEMLKMDILRERSLI